MDNATNIQDPSNGFLLFLSMLMMTGGMPPETCTSEPVRERGTD